MAPGIERLKRVLPSAVVCSIVLLAAPPAGPTAGASDIRLTITTSSDAANGDVTSVAGLLATPGTDGVSLREALLATNADPGRYEVRFAPSLHGAQLLVGSATGLALPPLAGGGVTVDGDVDGDDRPDVTIRPGRTQLSTCRLRADPTSEGEPCAFRIASSGNQLRSLVLTGFATGILFTPSSADDPQEAPVDRHETYARNVVSGLVMRDIGDAGVRLLWGSPECGDDPTVSELGEVCATHNRWTDTEIAGNSIETIAYGIHLKLNGSIGDRLERLTIANNTIRITGSKAEERIGIHLEAGLGIGSVRNRIQDALISGNTIVGRPQAGIRIVAGAIAGDRNVLERIRVVDNTVGAPECDPCEGIAVGLGESTVKIGWDLDRPDYADRNVARDIEIGGNTIRGGMQTGVVVSAGNGRGNVLADVRIAGNTIRLGGPAAGIRIETGACCDTPEEQPPTGTRLIGLEILDNRITIVDTGSADERGTGGIVLFPGTGTSEAGQIGDARVVGNRMDTWNLGINAQGGEWWQKTPPDVFALSLGPSVNENRLTCAFFNENVIDGTEIAPTVVVSPVDPLDLTVADRDAAWGSCTWDPRDADVVAALRGKEVATTEDEPSSSGSGSVAALVAIGALAAVGGLIFLIKRRSWVRSRS